MGEWAVVELSNLQLGGLVQVVLRDFRQLLERIFVSCRGEVALPSSLSYSTHNTHTLPFILFFRAADGQGWWGKHKREETQIHTSVCEGKHTHSQKTFPGQSPPSFCLLTHIPAWLCHWNGAGAAAATVHLILMRLWKTESHSFALFFCFSVAPAIFLFFLSFS